MSCGSGASAASPVGPGSAASIASAQASPGVHRGTLSFGPAGKRAVVQGLGAALFEHCRYDAAGQLLNGNMADYLVPMAGEMPDIDIAHEGRGKQRP